MIEKNEFLWSLEKISMSGDNGKRLQDVSVDLFPGITAIIGPSGAGKSSLLNILVEFEKAEAGSVKINDNAKTFFWVPPNHGLWPHLKVHEHLDLMARKPVKQATDKMLEKFEIFDKKNAYPAQLSQGEKSRLAMARALFASPAVLVMDEPLINIDPAKQLLFWDIVIETAKGKGISIIYATHSPKHVVGTADNVICMKEGEITYNGSVEQLYHFPPDIELAEYLGDINWIDESEGEILHSGLKTTFPLRLRPEQVHLRKTEDGGFRIIKSFFRGEITKSSLEHKASGNIFEFYHRPSRKPIDGEIVTIEFDI